MYFEKKSHRMQKIVVKTLISQIVIVLVWALVYGERPRDEC
jgi:hypothetical protein